MSDTSTPLNFDRRNTHTFRWLLFSPRRPQARNIYQPVIIQPTNVGIRGSRAPRSLLSNGFLHWLLCYGPLRCVFRSHFLCCLHGCCLLTCHTPLSRNLPCIPPTLCRSGHNRAAPVIGRFFCLMRIHQLLYLFQQNSRMHWLHQHPVSAQFLPVLIGDRKRCQQRDRRTIGRLARGPNHVSSRRVILHPHVGDHHAVFALTEFQPAVAGGSGCIHIKPADLQDCLHCQQHSHFIIHQQNPTFHSLSP